MRRQKIRYCQRLARWVVVLGALSCAAPALADTAVCTGKLTTLGNHANGYTGLWIVAGNNNIIRICSFNETQFSVTVEDCTHMASLAAEAFAMDANVTFYVDNAPSTVCTAIPN